ncbi:PTB/PI domain and Pleckstrin homology-like domain-containing protein [Strongyloides ratti]|uniref:PTB/PI domain and Pleckstrin homology-like domain-containing protein n=1 Tax=Strongyloides ratti TaxID=34506 RepID=A0A090MW79_STRRB|nr:PTB/PI domain and Pleckstrin homology-like domain-containing protein [Strongyloides ratti]CEF63513.1 PTB/PI domain and Pleckstrin homology-like domain-containing protein [Strongyloides ratti]
MPSLSNIKETSLFNLPFKKKRSYTINPPDDQYNVTYLGNVLTIIGKGNASIEKPLNLIWKTFCQKGQRCDMPMKLSVTRSGLKAETKQQGLTEYLPHRITYCIAPPAYPKIFCWVYKHEGKKMKPELRCHAVLCKKPNEPMLISNRLTDFLHSALQEYKREKILMQRSRKNAVTNGPCPKRKLLLQTGSLNFRPTLNKNKALSLLGSINEEEETVDDIENKINLNDEKKLNETTVKTILEKNEGSVCDYFDNDLLEEDEEERSFSKSCPVYYLPSTSGTSLDCDDFSMTSSNTQLDMYEKHNDVKLKRKFSLTKNEKDFHKESLGKILEKQKTIYGLSSSLNNISIEEDDDDDDRFIENKVNYNNFQNFPTSSFSLDVDCDKKIPNFSNENNLKEIFVRITDKEILLEEDDLSSYEKSQASSVDFESSTSSCSSIDEGFNVSDLSKLKNPKVELQFSKTSNNKDKDVDCISDESGYHEETFRLIHQEREKNANNINCKKNEENNQIVIHIDKKDKYADYEISDI